MFSNFPRFTMKSIRRCPKCDHFNGFRAKMCGNKKCKLPFKASSKKLPVEACKIQTSFISPNCVSVRLRNKGPDYRAFVELHEVQTSHSASNQNVAMVSARCCVPLCLKAMNSMNGENNSKCTHIEAAMNCVDLAEPLHIKQSVLNMLSDNEKLWHYLEPEILGLNFDTSSPLVQRVSPQVLVVKSSVSVKHHLGYLHISFKADKNNGIYSCSCEFNGNSAKKRKPANSNKEIVNVNNQSKHCVHFYLCICAFASDQKLCQEFECFIKMGLPNFQEHALDDESQSENDNMFLSGPKFDENLEFSDNVSLTQEMSENLPSPFISQMIELPDGNGHMIELKADLQLSQKNQAIAVNRENNDVLICKSDLNSNQVVKACDVLLANSANNVLTTKNRDSGSLDIQIMLSENGNLISLSDVVDETSDTLITNTENYNQNSKNNRNFIQSNNEVINIEQVAVQESNVSKDVYTISGDDTSLKIISLEQYESLFAKTNDCNSFSNSDCNDNTNYSFNSSLIDNPVQTLNEDPMCQHDTSTQESTFHNIYIPEADDGLFSLDNNYELLTSISQGETCSPITKNMKKRKKNNSNDPGKSTITVAPSDNHQSYEFVDSLETFIPTANGTISNIITFNQPEENQVANTSSIINLPNINYSTKYFVATANKANHSKKSEVKKSKVEHVEVKNDSSKEAAPQNAANLSFFSWLASVTENINQSMHYQCKGTPDPLVFHIPQTFFDCLEERISDFGTKKRLPDVTLEFVRKKSVPLGKFTMYTWNITNVFKVKKIFDTPEIELQITRFFTQNMDGTYSHMDNPNTKKSKTLQLKKIYPKKLKKNSKHHLPVKITPRKTFLTYLKVGNTTPHQKVPTPFCIQWIPNILPLTKVGELRIKFEFGHKNNYIPQTQGDSNFIFVKTL